MGSGFNDYGQYVFILLGIFCIGRGIMILITGKLGEKEEAGLRDYSPEGIRKYKLLSVILNIFGGAFVIVSSVIKMLKAVDTTVYSIIMLAVVALMIVIYIVGKRICKNTK
ncbi:MAG: hypothetical protein Q4D71_12930 [Oscillospiraceae bacterium]|nr:hypothetical protein [Oscillospiraceae bacterium]